MDESLLLPLPKGCIRGSFIRRVKRFSVEFEHDGQILWAHSNNSGSMLGLLRPGSEILLSPASNPARKLQYTLELCRVGGIWVGVNTLSPNRLLRKAFYAGLLPWAGGYTDFKSEAVYGQSRFDALLTAANKPPLWVECKNVTLVEDGGVAAFPDAVSERAQKHLRQMCEIVKTGARAAFFYCIQRSDASCFAPADYVDPEYARLFFAALDAGVEVYPHKIAVGEAGLGWGKTLPVLDNPNTLV